LNLPDQNGALVGDVETNTPAQKANIQSGDVILAIDGKKVNDANSLRLMVSEMSPGTNILIKLLRQGREKTVTVSLAALPEMTAGNANRGKNSGSPNGRTDALEGVTVADLDQSVRQQLNLPVDVLGVVVTDVDQDSNAAEADLQPNDIILQINQQPVRDADAAVKLCAQAKGNWIILKIWRRTGDLAATRFLSVDNRAKGK
jgi:serine protease Do